MIDVKKYGKDHCSLLSYIGVLIKSSKDSIGIIDKRKLRCNSNTRPLFNLNDGEWKESWGTKLKGYFSENGNDESRLLKKHDDWDCLQDLDNSGFIKFITLTIGGVVLTNKGIEVLLKLKKHKLNGGKYSNFINQ